MAPAKGPNGEKPPPTSSEKKRSEEDLDFDRPTSSTRRYSQINKENNEEMARAFLQARLNKKIKEVQDTLIRDYSSWECHYKRVLNFSIKDEFAMIIINDFEGILSRLFKFKMKEMQTYLL